MHATRVHQLATHRMVLHAGTLASLQAFLALRWCLAISFGTGVPCSTRGLQRLPRFCMISGTNQSTIASYTTGMG